jgi:hypothetical protein
MSKRRKNKSEGCGRRSNKLKIEDVIISTPMRTLSISEAIRAFLQDADIRNLSKRTISWYRGSFLGFLTS